MLTLTDDNYAAELAKANLPVLLVFRASFCGPSAYMEPVIEDTIADFEGQITVTQIDVEDCPKLTRQMQVKNSPTFIVVNQGVPVASMAGTMAYKDFVGFIGRSLCIENSG